MDFYDRLKAFLKKKNLKVAAFEAKLGFSNGSLSKAIEQKRGIGSDRLETIFSHYPEFSAEWLFKQIGEMEIDPSKITAMAAIEDLRKTIESLEKVIGHSENLLNDYRTQLNDYRSQIEEYKRKAQNVAKGK